MMLCPLKFARYEFEGGEECIGAECGFYGAVCRNDDSEPKSDVSATDADANDTCDALDTREKLEEDACEFVRSAWHAGRRFETGGTPNAWNSDELFALLDRQAAITERECLVQSVQGADAILTAENAELQAAYDELTEIAAQLCRACGFSMVDAAGEVVS